MRLKIPQIAALLLLVFSPAVALAPLSDSGSSDVPIVYTTLPASARPGSWDGARLMRREPDGGTRPLSTGFHSAADPAISFDGLRVLFAGKRRAADRWQIFESSLDGNDVKQLTSLHLDCRQPVYQSRFFTLDAPTPWDQVAFVAGGQLHSVPLEMARSGNVPPQQITFLPGEVRDPVVAPDGRVVFSYRESSSKPSRLFGVNLDGTDYALFSGAPPVALRMAAVQSEESLVVIEDGQTDPWGAGSLGTMSLQRPQGGIAPALRESALRFHSPKALPGNSILVAARDTGAFGIARLDPSLRNSTWLVRDATQHLLQPQPVAPTALPDGRGSVVDPSVEWAVLYCQSVYVNDLPREKQMPRGMVRSVRVFTQAAGKSDAIGEGPVEQDGSFHLRVPANRPLRLELLDQSGAVLRRGAWIYARNKESRGCIGCHEDPELTPANRVPMAIEKPPVNLSQSPGASLRGGGR
ncbi:MAG: hypothetical protein U5J83_13295 [Bryobacterales bacterium]|nr:hypothetical protein [Bryobacterales bacterium]